MKTWLRTPRTPFATFLQRAQAAHGTRYEYALAERDYSGLRHAVRIACRTHGVFEQQAFAHAAGAGCPACYRESGRAAEHGRTGGRKRWGEPSAALVTPAATPLLAAQPQHWFSPLQEQQR